MDAKTALKISTTGLAGMFAGAAMYINAADHPARMTLDTPNCRKHWLEAYNRARLFQGGMCMTGSLSGLVIFYLEKDASKCDKLPWLIGACVFVCVLPFTRLIMMADIKKNCQDDILETAGEKWSRNHIVRWNKQHLVRTILGTTAFGIFLYGLSRK